MILDKVSVYIELYDVVDSVGLLLISSLLIVIIKVGYIGLLLF